MHGEVRIGRSIYGVVVINGSLCSRVYGNYITTATIINYASIIYQGLVVMLVAVVLMMHVNYCKSINNSAGIIGTNILTCENSVLARARCFLSPANTTMIV